MNVLIFVSNFYPGFEGGGPGKSIKLILDNHDTELGTLYVVTKNGESGNRSKYNEIIENKEYDFSNGKVIYVNINSFLCFDLLKFIRKRGIQAIYLNSYFSFQWAILPRFFWLFYLTKTCRLIIAPRGEISTDLLAWYSLKKWIYIYFIEVTESLFVKKSNIKYYHLTSSFEIDNIPDFIKSKIKNYEIIPNFIENQNMVDHRFVTQKHPNKLRAVFISRIDPKKNVEFIIRIILKYNLPIELDIYGPYVDFSYFRRIDQLIEESDNKICYKGALNPADIHRTLSNYNLFVLPTKNENYGHVIMESLQAGVPAVISNRTPWESTDDNVINALPLEEEIWLNKLLELIALSPEDYNNLYKLVRMQVKLRQDNQGHIINKYKRLFN